MADINNPFADYLSMATRPLTRKHLAFRLCMTTRQVEAAVQDLRLAGEPICSSGLGYWYSTSPDEIEAMAERLRSRILTQFKTRRGLLKAARALRERNAGQRQKSMFA